GFCTDLTSVPQLFWSLLPRTGRYAYAAIVHDYLYWVQGTTRKQADDILFAAMEDTQVPSFTRSVIYSGVRAGGSFAWDTNRKAKASGAKRVLRSFPSRYQLVSWKEWSSDPTHFAD